MRGLVRKLRAAIAELGFEDETKDEVTVGDLLEKIEHVTRALPGQSPAVHE